MRILGIDPGEKNIGVSISDPTGTLASPLTIIQHTSRDLDAASISAIARENEVDLIIVGQALDHEGIPTVSGRSAKRLAATIKRHIDIPVVLWDESLSTQEARKFSSKKQRKRENEHLDDLAASIILQSYLDTVNDS